MRQLFGHKWASQAGPAKLENGRYSPEFLLWCRKLEGLSDAAYQRGFNQIEFLVKEAARQGDEMWPPSYAGFLGYCEEAPRSAMYKHFPPIGIEDKTKREKDREIGKREAKKLLAELAAGETGPAGD